MKNGENLVWGDIKEILIWNENVPFCPLTRFDSLTHLLSKTFCQKIKLGEGGYSCYKIGYGLLGIVQENKQDLGSFCHMVSTSRKKDVSRF